jgi:hypothetical protein
MQHYSLVPKFDPQAHKHVPHQMNKKKNIIMIYKMATKNIIPFRNYVTKNKYLYLKFLGGYNFNGTLNMKVKS